MDTVRLHFPDSETEPLRLSPGTHGIGWCGDGLGLVTQQADVLLRVQVDPRGIWLHITQNLAICVHVNGRQVYRIALLRSGDVLHIDTTELRLVTEPPPFSQQPRIQGANEAMADPRWVLRGLGGHHHGRCFPLDRPRWVGRSATADIQIDDPTLSERHVCLQRVQDQVFLRSPDASDGCLVNGQRIRDAVLTAGDQLVFGARHRFVIEAPQANKYWPPADSIATGLPASPPPRPAWHLLWLLAAAALLAASLTGLLLFGTAV